MLRSSMPRPLGLGLGLGAPFNHTVCGGEVRTGYYLLVRGRIWQWRLCRKSEACKNKAVVEYRVATPRVRHSVVFVLVLVLY